MYAEGTNINCASKVPIICPHTIKITVLLNISSVHSPFTTSSVSMDMYGSMKMNNKIVAPLLITEDKLVQVALKLGFKQAAYKEAITPTEEIEPAITLSTIILLDMVLYFVSCEKLLLFGIYILALNCSIPAFEKP